VADLLSREVASILQKEVKDPRIGIITITGADVSPDLHMAKVFYTVFGDEAAHEHCAEGLVRASGFIRREVSKRLKLRTVPELRFVFDESFERGIHIEELLEKPRPPSTESPDDVDDDESDDDPATGD
jgi:ribosome-binding factor A